jgi:predicted RNase H-like HicB family nuclease
MALSKPTVGKYRAQFELDDDGVWLASVEELPEVTTFGSTLGKAREYLLDALALWLNTSVARARASIVHSTVILPDHVQLAVDNALAMRALAESTTNVANALLTEAAIGLVTDAHLSRRDAGDLLDLSHQRVQQLVVEGLAHTEPGVLAPNGARDLADRLKEFLPGGPKEDLGVLIGGVAVGLALLWAQNSD